MPFTEANYENAVIEVFRNVLGYRYVYGPDVARDYSDPLYMNELLPALRRVNPNLPEAAISEAVHKLRNFDGGTTLQKNARFMDCLQNGVVVNYFNNGKQRSTLLLRLISGEYVCHAAGCNLTVCLQLILHAKRSIMTACDSK